MLASALALALRPARQATPTGTVVINGFDVRLEVIPDGRPVPAPSDSPGRSVVVVPLSGGFTLAMTETGPSAALVEHWEQVEAREQFRRNGWTFDRVTGDLLGPMPGDEKGGAR